MSMPYTKVVEMILRPKNRYASTFVLVFCVFFASACQRFSSEGSLDTTSESVQGNLDRTSFSIQGDRNFLIGYEPIFPDGDINVVVEISTGSVEKWEVNKSTGTLDWEFVDGAPRRINYLGYPANYGMVPKTLLPKVHGGDGDPLDVIVLGPAVERGSVIKCKLIGVLKLLDGDEQDDKLIAVTEDSPFYDVDRLSDLDAEFHGVTEIIKLWFSNYKGPGKLQVKGFAEADTARGILLAAVQAYSRQAKTAASQVDQ